MNHRRQDDRGRQIEAVLDEVIAHRLSGLSIEDEVIRHRYPQLMPELGQRLEMLRDVERAARHARIPSSALPGLPPDAAPPDPDVDYLRQVLPGYDILERLHHGAQGVVYKAVQQCTHRVVALKVLKHGPFATPRERRRFEREIDIISRLRHPNIVTIYDSGTLEGRHYFAMEYVEGLAIDDYALLHDLSIDERLRLFTVVCRAVSFAHQRGIIHRDLKPSNVLIDLDGSVRLLDFGLAKDLAPALNARDESSLSLDGQVVGTMPYLSPEQARGDDVEVDVRSDIYTLGVMLFELLTEMLPYPVSADPLKTRITILSAEPWRLKKAMQCGPRSGRLASSRIDPDLQAITSKALSKDQATRYQSAAALADDIDRYLSGRPVDARPHRLWYLLRKSLRLHRAQAAVAAGFLAMLLGGSALITHLWLQARTQRDAARQVAHIAQAGLQMGSHLKLGSVHRDEGRLDQAIAMWEKALEIADTVPDHDPIVARYRYESLHRLAELYYREQNTELADRYGRQAVALAERMSRQHPDDLEWARLLGFSCRLRGEMAAARNNWNGALKYFDQALTIRTRLADAEAHNIALKAEVASIHGWLGRCHRMLDHPENALHHYTSAYRICCTLADLEPDVPDRIIAVVQIQIKLAAWHLAQKTERDDAHAAEWLQQAEQRLQHLVHTPAGTQQRWITGQLSDAIRQNQALLAKRQSPR